MLFNFSYILFLLSSFLSRCSLDISYINRKSVKTEKKRSFTLKFSINDYR